MRRTNTLLPILSAFLCGYHLPELARRIDTSAGVHSFTDLSVWIIVPVTGLWALAGVWRAFKTSAPTRTPD